MSFQTDRLLIRQRIISRNAALGGPARQSSAAAKLAEQGAALSRKIDKWVVERTIHMPRTSRFITSPLASSFASTVDPFENESDHESDEDIEARDPLPPHPLGVKSMDLLLPSSKISISHGLASDDLIKIETRLREVQLEGLIKELCRLLHIKAGVYIDKKRHAVAQKANTRSVSRLQEYDAKIAATSRRYRLSRDALKRIDPMGQWEHRLRELQDSDVRPIHHNASDVDEPDEEVVDEAARRAKKKKRRIRPQARREISWIWKLPPKAGFQSSEVGEANEEEEVSNGAYFLLQN